MSQLDVAQRIGFAPITRIDADRREIEVTATSEAIDAFDTVFDYDASRDAFERWLGNVREMHSAIAVGRRVAVLCDPDRREIRVRLRISRGAESTWQKILDGTLCGASIGASNVRWREARRGDLAGPDDAGDPAEVVRVATAYDLVELSLVDNPANPDCAGITLVRAAAPDTALLDPLDDEPAEPAAGETEPDVASPAHLAMRALAQACGCAICERVLAELDGSAQRGVPLSEMRADVRRVAARLAALRGTMEALAQRQSAALQQIAARVEAIAGQPQAGGPVLRASEKRLGGTGASHNIAERIAALQEFGAAPRDQQTQIALAAEILRLQQES
jgi:hypothetical protein